MHRGSTSQQRKRKQKLKRKQKQTEKNKTKTITITKKKRKQHQKQKREPKRQLKIWLKKYINKTHTAFFKAIRVLRNHTCHVLEPAIHKPASKTKAVEEDEFEIAGINKLNSVDVKPPRIKEAHIAMEGKLYRHIEVGNSHGDMILIEIIRIHIDDSVLDERGKPDVSKIEPLARLGGREYASLNNAWEIIRPD